MEYGWRVTRELTQADIRCDLCGEPADTIHILPYVTRAETIVFSCLDHCPVPEGYGIDVDRYFADPEARADHLRSKRNGEDAYFLILDRLFQIEQDLAKGLDCASTNVEGEK